MGVRYIELCEKFVLLWFGVAMWRLIHWQYPPVWPHETSSRSAARSSGQASYKEPPFRLPPSHSQGVTFGSAIPSTHGNLGSGPCKILSAQAFHKLLKMTLYLWFLIPEISATSTTFSVTTLFKTFMKLKSRFNLALDVTALQWQSQHFQSLQILRNIQIN